MYLSHTLSALVFYYSLLSMLDEGESCVGLLYCEYSKARPHVQTKLDIFEYFEQWTLFGT